MVAGGVEGLWRRNGLVSLWPDMLSRGNDIFSMVKTPQFQFIFLGRWGEGGSSSSHFWNWKLTQAFCCSVNSNRDLWSPSMSTEFVIIMHFFYLKLMKNSQHSWMVDSSSTHVHNAVCLLSLINNPILGLMVFRACAKAHLKLTNLALYSALSNYWKTKAVQWRRLILWVCEG